MVNKSIDNFSPKERIIRQLIENKNPQSIRTISEATLIDYKNAYNLISELKQKVISKEKIGNTSLIKLKLIPNADIYSAEIKRTNEFLLKNPKLRIVQNYIQELSYPFFIVLVFGSYVKNTKIASSDIDICIIADNSEKIKELMSRLNTLSIKLEIHEFTTNEFISMIEKSQNNLGHEIIKNNIILYGIENYYNLITKWMNKE